MPYTSPPSSIYAGDSWDWENTFSSYPATSYQAECVFSKPGEDVVKVDGSADGSAFDFTLSTVKSGSLKDGIWSWAIRVWDSTTSKIVKTGEIFVRPDPTATPETTHAEKCVALIEAALEERFVDVQESVSLLGQDITKTAVETLNSLRAHYLGEVNRERHRRQLELTGRRRRRGRFILSNG